MPEFEWNDQRNEAAQLIASGRLTFGEVASKLGITERWLYEWRRQPEFEARVDALVDEIRATLRRRAIALPEQRVARLNNTWLRLQRLIHERSEDPEMADVPGGTTGLLVKTYKIIGGGENARMVTEFTYDAAVARELRDLEKQAAQEMGQWAEKHDVTSNGQTVAVQVYLPANGRDHDTTELESPGGVPIEFG